MVVITLKSLLHPYEHFIEMLNITATNVDLTFPDLYNKLLQQNRWKQQFGTSATSSSSVRAFPAKTFQKNKGKPSSFQQHNQGQSADSSKSKNIQCNYCHRFGHMKKDCRNAWPLNKASKESLNQKYMWRSTLSRRSLPSLHSWKRVQQIL